ncbi:MAG: hypothetical protein SGI96_12950 [Bacteroidota bacterium]|nr:hypothetical protein [Bacteroidota bacterium]
MARLFQLLIILLFPLLSFGQEWKTFTDTAGKFTAKYPQKWINKVKEGNRVFFTSPADTATDDFFENINVNVTQKGGYGTEIKVKDLFPAVTNAVKGQFKEYKQEPLRYFKWNNVDAVEVIYSGYNKLDESIKVRTTQWYCFYKSRLYMTTFVADANNSSHNETARKIMTSIVFK